MILFLAINWKVLPHILYFISVVPRLLFDRWTGKDYVRLFTEKNRVLELATVISDTVKVLLS